MKMTEKSLWPHTVGFYFKDEYGLALYMTYVSLIWSSLICTWQDLMNYSM